MKTDKAKSGGSTLADKFRKQKADLLKRHQEQVDTKDQGNEFPSVFDKTKIPKGIEFWNCKKGEHMIDIIPFFAGSQHPKTKQGELTYVVDFWVHQNVGPLRTPYPCTTKNFKESDPICDYIAKNRLDKDEWKRVSSKRRTAYLVWVHDTPEDEKKGLQIWEVSHYFFEQHIDELAKSPRGGGAEAFSDIDTGKSIWFNVKVTGKYKDASGTDQDSIGFVGHKFVNRDIDSIPVRILSQTFSLDEAIKMRPDNEEMAEAFFGPPKAKAKARYAEPEEDEDDSSDDGRVDDDDDIPSKGQKAQKGRKRPEPESEEDVKDDVDEDVDEDVNEDDDSDSNEDSDGDNDSGDDSEDDGEDITECPHDPDSFGEVDEHDECEMNGGCPLWDECSDEAAKRAKAAEKIKDKKPAASSNKRKKVGKK